MVDKQGNQHNSIHFKDDSSFMSEESGEGNLEEPDDLSEHTDATNSGPHATTMTAQERQDIAAAEDRAVQCFRAVVLVVLAVAAALATYFVHVYMTDQETAEFEVQFHSDAEKVMQSFGKQLDDTLGACDSFITTLNNFVHATNATWPFVTLTHFGVQAAKLLRLSKGFSMGLSNVVLPEQKQAWEDYARTHEDWIHETFDVMESDESWPHAVNREFMTLPIFGLAGPVTEPAAYSLPRGSGSYAPSWTQYPVVPEAFLGFPYNFDGWQVPPVAETCINAQTKKKITISQEWTGIMTDPTNPIVVQTAQNAWQYARLFKPADYNVKEPSGLVLIPVYDNALDTVRIDTEQYDNPVSYFTISYFIKDLLKDILPEQSRGVLVVVDSACGVNQTFTYQLDGRETTFLGVGDFHESKYTKYEYKATFGQMMDVTKSGRANSHYTGLPLDDDFCTKTFRIYPSQTMEDEYRTSSPVVTTVLAAAIFVFTTVVFLIYDLIVARRQKVVLGRALASGAIVNSLFPQKVRDQLYDEQEAGQAQQNKNASSFQNPQAKEEATTTTKDRPIASLHEETTIFFADLAGFTQWSSTRSPVEVFELLETIYQRFDMIARRRSVFKVETIGDCYVAATGLPEPQRDHAIRMVKFAKDCQLAMSQTLAGLVDKLGADTLELEMRVGLHSGPTTAGVLRGEKGRFQLFGDTVNTASRMESNGVRGKIHVSEATKLALEAQGKAHWCVPRPDHVEVKGKGVMQTYFIGNTSAARSSASRWTETDPSSKDSALDDASSTMVAEQLQRRLSKDLAGSRS